jgi:type IV secretory pathway TrbD component
MSNQDEIDRVMRALKRLRILTAIWYAVLCLVAFLSAVTNQGIFRWLAGFPVGLLIWFCWTDIKRWFVTDPPHDFRK